MAMAEELPIAEPFSADLQWPANPGKGGDLLIDQSLARLLMTVDGTSITEFRTEKGDGSTRLTVPLYFVVEWLALNWWSFLYEPRKLEGAENEQDFRLRHWLGTARNGFALPDVTFSPIGDKIEVTARSASLRFARLSFVNSATALVRTEKVRSELAGLIDAVLVRLTEGGVRKSAAHEAWEQIKKTTAEEEPYCRLVGSLGLSPYVSREKLDSSLEDIAEKISVSMLADLCDAANIKNFSRAVELTDNIAQQLEKVTPSHLRKLLAAVKPVDNRPEAYEWGYQAVDAARSALRISNDDPAGAMAFFDQMQIDPKSGLVRDLSKFPIVSAAVSREDDDLTRIALAGLSFSHRKFAAARAAFLAWSSENSASRLATSARTRDQQASRAFAAELLAPIRFLRKRLGDRGSDVHGDKIESIAAELEVARDVVFHQAANNGYHVAARSADLGVPA
jgi:hypothetical protein